MDGRMKKKIGVYCWLKIDTKFVYFIRVVLRFFDYYVCLDQYPFCEGIFKYEKPKMSLKGCKTLCQNCYSLSI